MQQRRRPTGTDGSDFSYRMVVDSRYTKVAKGKSRLASLIVSQAINQVIGFLWMFLSISQEHEVDKLAILSISVGAISLLIGELGRRRSQVISLRMYTGLSSIATLSSVGSFVRSDLFTKITSHELCSRIRNDSSCNWFLFCRGDLVLDMLWDYVEFSELHCVRCTAFRHPAKSTHILEHFSKRYQSINHLCI
ncbi:hypothetical protein ACMD2_14261 [Ananas comosus]|uniref:Uncharacterized protein n=1 Tax=Ananas comosus TaxID=4615 RepID=A0A199UTS1_ANACO|nr:hypothetical protein ACMD2_14261 [Ananas comosus]